MGHRRRNREHHLGTKPDAPDWAALAVPLAGEEIVKPLSSRPRRGYLRCSQFGAGPRFLRRSRVACERQLAPSGDSYWSRVEPDAAQVHGCEPSPQAPHPIPLS